MFQVVGHCKKQLFLNVSEEQRYLICSTACAACKALRPKDRIVEVNGFSCKKFSSAKLRRVAL
jgi:hypothetical protein